MITAMAYAAYRKVSDSIGEYFSGNESYALAGNDYGSMDKHPDSEDGLVTLMGMAGRNQNQGARHKARGKFPYVAKGQNGGNNKKTTQKKNARNKQDKANARNRERLSTSRF